MKTTCIVVLTVFLACGGATPAHAQKKDTLLLMQRLDTMQQMMINMQKTLDTQTAVLKTLIEQANDNVNSMKVVMEDLRKSTGQNLANNNARFDTMTNEIQSLTSSQEEILARIAKLSEQVAQTQNIIQTLNAPPPTPAAGATGDPNQPVPPTVPDAETLYKSGLTAFNGGQYQLAVQSFQEYLQYYGSTDLASNAQFYIGEAYYSQGDYAKAIEEYNKCVEQYPKGNKVAAAQLKKGYALLAQDKESSGIRELRSLIQRFPNSREADLARQRLKKLGVSAGGRSGF
ncbi:MAG: tol-pal system protein YbgF [Acidobacteria bacterium]|nr:tol-pal system protein YbgF [Acidobacteriota bacterium]